MGNYANVSKNHNYNVIASDKLTVIASAASQSHDTGQCPTSGDYDVAVNTAPRNDALLQRGRSMIEMLGVLAIIGVLSVGGIMGYSKAMFRYKVNKTIEQITYIAGNVRTAFANQGNYVGANNRDIQKKAHIVPDDMWKDAYSLPQHAWEGFVSIDPKRKNSADTNGNKAFDIYYMSLPEEACIELITHDWKNAQVNMIYVSSGTNYPAVNQYIIPPAKLDDAVKICSPKIWDVLFYFDIDTSDSYWKDKIDATTAALSGS